MLNYKIACVIVTYNRKDLLKRCLNTVNKQCYKPSVVYIIDNASTDGTIDAVKEWGFFNCVNNGIEYKYVLNEKNEGGAGGFYLGMKTAFESSGADALWVMDDDGEPASDCLELMVPYLSQYDYVAPLVVSIEDRMTCAFKPNTSVEDFQQSAINGIVEDWASPFNGILYSAKLIKKIGFPKKEMFIWGDEVNYHWRAKNSQMPPITVVKALHFHPKCKHAFVKTIGNRDIFFVPQFWKGYCQYRNVMYNKWHVLPSKNLFSRLYDSLVYYYLHSYYFVKVKKDLRWQWCFTKAFFAGLFGVFGGQWRYMK